jgi:peptidoglycan/xylan/chitin deacetylase (PgdA/CDA1 family)
VHIVTLSFDDGFERSSRRTAEIFERHGLVAELNVIAAGDLGKSADAWHSRWRKGDFELWNGLKARGHVVMPHGYRHANKAELPFAEAQRLIELCLETFEAELEGFEASQATFAFPYNRSTPPLEAWLAGRVRAFRTGGDPVMPLPQAGQQRVTCAGFGPEGCDDHLLRTVESFLAGPPGWLCYNLHGLDDEGWGPVGADTLGRLLERLVAGGVHVLPIRAALDLAAAGLPGQSVSGVTTTDSTERLTGPW